MNLVFGFYVIVYTICDEWGRLRSFQLRGLAAASYSLVLLRINNYEYGYN